MNQISITGANGFLGWHVRCAAVADGRGAKYFEVGENFSIARAISSLDHSTDLLHIAGVNRGTNEEVFDGNVLFAQQVSESLLQTKTPPKRVIFANSIQSDTGTNYGDSKKKSSEILRDTSERLGLEFIDVKIPNVFGEHGRPFYNAVTSTFCHLASRGEELHVDENREITLVHAQDVADRLLSATSQTVFESKFERIDVSSLKAKIQGIADTYRSGTIPKLDNDFDRNLFNTYRSYLLPDRIQIPLIKNQDSRGSFFEIIRNQSGSGQTSFSTTVPGVTRGDHFHRRKIERFTVISGTGLIQMRKMFSTEVLSFHVSGDVPVSIDMPTLWTHSITNIESPELLTAFWINEIFDPTAPDTIHERVINEPKA